MGYKRVMTICKCGCEQEFLATLTYRSKADGGGLRTPEYKAGHHPNCKKTAFNKSNTPWNKGLKKGDHPSIDRMGFQVGHEAYNDWSKVHELQRNDPEYRAKWIASKQGQKAWNKGLTNSDYVNPVRSGKDHGNWKGGHRGAVDTAAWQKLRRDILKRDDYRCQECGDRNRKGRGSRINLEVHHIIAISVDPKLALDAANCITLCRPCHYKTHSFGGKALNRSGKASSAK